jgi:hypothetical protein
MKDMAFPAVGTILLCSLLALTACGAVMMCVEQIAHVTLLANSIPVETLTAVTALLSLCVAATVGFATSPGEEISPTLTRDGRAPDQLLRAPLALAFSDGVLNTKAF